MPEPACIAVITQDTRLLEIALHAATIADIETAIAKLSATTQLVADMLGLPKEPS